MPYVLFCFVTQSHASFQINTFDLLIDLIILMIESNSELIREIRSTNMRESLEKRDVYCVFSHRIFFFFFLKNYGNNYNYILVQ